MTFNRRIMLAGCMGAAVGPSVASALGMVSDIAAYDAALEATFHAKGPPALAGAVVNREGLIWSGVRGIRRIGDAEEATVQDRWHLGSNTKAMTAAVYARLVEQGRASWDTPLSGLFPGATIDPAWDGVTIKDFLHHRAGLKDAEALGPIFFMTARDNTRPLPEQRRTLIEQALLRPPGGPKGTFEYGNANYILAGAAIEQITGQPWEEAMRTELFQPLGLSSAGFGAPLHDMSGGTNTWGHQGRTPMDPASPGSDNPLALGPAGTAHMTLDDYGRWLRVFLNGGEGWISADSVTALATPGAGAGMPYALGWITPPTFPGAEGPALVHEGSNTLWHAAAIVAPARGLAFVAVTNVGVQGQVASDLMQRLFRA